MGLNHAQYGSPLSLGYSHVLTWTRQGLQLKDIGDQFGLQFLSGGLWGQLVNTDHGLLYTNVVAVLGLVGAPLLFRRSARDASYVFLVAGSVYVFHALFELWYVSHPGSNRYLFPMIGLMAMPFAVLIEKVGERHDR